MIFTTVGITHLPFDRLVKGVDELAKTSRDEFVIQIGHSTYEPNHARWFRFDTPKRMLEWIEQSEIVVTHGGYGIISECLRARKRIIASPRRVEFGEAVNPQHELVEFLAEKGLLITLDEVAQLDEAIEQAWNMPLPSWPFESRIPHLVAQFVGDLEAAKSAKLHA